MNKIKGDLIELAKQGIFDAIVHGCNCYCTMGAGIAKHIKNEFPDAYIADKKTIPGDGGKLGLYTSANIGNLTVINAYTQFGYGAGLQVNYDAIKDVFIAINNDFSGKRIGIPKIGCGLAGGNWDIVEKIINSVTDSCEITLVEFD